MYHVQSYLRIGNKKIKSYTNICQTFTLGVVNNNNIMDELYNSNRYDKCFLKHEFSN